MAGLLDFLKTPEGQGLLSAGFGAAAGARPGQPWNTLGRGGLAGLAGYTGAQDRITQEAESEAQRKYRDMQMKTLESQMAKQVAQEKWSAGLSDVMAPKPQEIDQFTGTTQMQAPSQEVVQRYLMDANSPFRDKMIERQLFPKEQEAFTLGEGQVRYGPQGKVVAQGPAKVDAPPSSVREYEYGQGNPAFNSWLINNKRAGATKVEVNSGQKDVQWGVPPKDMVWARDQRGNVITQPDPKTGAFSPMAIPIAGSAIEAGNVADAEKARQRVAAAKSATANVLSAIKGAKELVGGTTAGMGSVLSVVPGTSARNLSAQLETVKANLGFDRLQQMRDMSPTGGALGSVAVQELTALQSTVASLDQAQSPSQLKSNILKAEKHYNNWLKIMEGKMPDTDGDDKTPPVQSFDDPAKEKRYQDWVRSQGGQR